MTDTLKTVEWEVTLLVVDHPLLDPDAPRPYRTITLETDNIRGLAIRLALKQIKREYGDAGTYEFVDAREAE